MSTTKLSPFVQGLTFNTLSAISVDPAMAVELFPTNVPSLLTGGHGARFEKFVTNESGERVEKPGMILNITPQRGVEIEDQRKFRLTFRTPVDSTLYPLLDAHCLSKIGLPADCCGTHATFTAEVTERGTILRWDMSQFNINEIYSLVRVERTKKVQRGTSSYTFGKDGALIIKETEVSSIEETESVSFFVNGHTSPLVMDTINPTWNKQPLTPEQFVASKVLPFGLGIEQCETLTLHISSKIETLFPGSKINESQIVDIYSQRMTKKVVAVSIGVPKVN